MRVSTSLRAVAAMLLTSLLSLGGCGGGGGGGEPPPVAPSIAAAPQDLTVADGGSANFSVAASGSGPLSYQWQRNGSDIAGATLASYKLGKVTLTDSGSKFQVLVSNSAGRVVSTAALLTVTPIALNITQQPTSLSRPDGSSASFSVQVTGSEPVSYQWRRDGSPIPGATNAAYTTTTLGMADDQARIDVDISNPAGSVRSQLAILTVTPTAAAIVTAPQSLTVADGGDVTLSVSATGTAPLSYQWKRNGVPISGATQASLDFKASFAAPADSYSVLVSNAAGAAESGAAKVTVNPLAAAFVQQPLAQQVATGDAVSLTVLASGTPPLRYQWQRSDDSGRRWADLPGATSTSYRIASGSLGDTGMLYRVAVSNPAATTYSASAALTVQPTIRVLAGQAGGRGYAEGQGQQARFDMPDGIVSDMLGNLYVADTQNHVIRRVSPQGVTSLYAGQPNQQGSVNGHRLAARLSYPQSMAMGADGTLYFSETCEVRKIDPSGHVSSVAGAQGRCMAVDGAADQVGFSNIRGIAVDASGQVFVADGYQSYAVRKISRDGSVSTLAGKIGQAGDIDGPGPDARFSSLQGITIAPDGNLYVIDGYAVRHIAPDGRVSRYAGAVKQSGTIEGDRLSAARFLSPRALSVSAAGQLFVADYNRVLRIDASGMVLATAGTSYYPGLPAPPAVDGIGAAARFYSLAGITHLPDGNMALVESELGLIRLISVFGETRTLAGLTRLRGSVDGAGASALLNMPRGVALDIDGSTLVADSGSHRIRRIAADGTVSTFAGKDWGSADGALASASFSMPTAMALDRSGNVYVLEATSSTIRKISSSGVVSTVAGRRDETGGTDGPGAVARFSYPRAIKADAGGNLVVADTHNCTVRRITPDGIVSTLAGLARQCGYLDGIGSQARLGYITDIVLDSRGRVFIAEQGTATIRRIDPDGLVTTVAGAYASPAVIDELIPYARMHSASALAIDAKDNLYIADHGGGLIRRLTPGGLLTTVAGQRGVRALKPGANGAINRVEALAVRPDGRLVFTTEDAVVTD